MSSKLTRAAAIVAAVGATDLTEKEGCLVTLSEVSSVLTATLSASATVAAKGVVLVGGDTDEDSTILILGGGCANLKAGGTIAKGAFVQQDSDEQVVTDAGSGARVIVGVAIESAVAGDLFEVATLPPQVFSA
jgi:hypothetical protein